ncbi:hypothetical protein EVAR_46148_1 [Eumeta japonica]|uniref:Uncharacterized protein n=1 Tax=Eumeta variegata TaxID=151549 RepID=A0A4C2AES0_EUMVA|nr:hypothetical protein EVAR_46148_1 [Eumeta japonica]
MSSSGLASKRLQVALIQVVMAGDLVRRGDCDGRSSRVIVRHWMSRSTPFGPRTFIFIRREFRSLICHWHNFQQRFDSPVPIFVTVSLTADSFGAPPARSPSLPCSDGAAYGGRGYTLRSLSHGSTRAGAFCYAQKQSFHVLQSPISHHYLAQRRHAASLCSDAHFEHFAVTSVCVFTLKASRRRGARSAILQVRSRLTARRRPGVDGG